MSALLITINQCQDCPCVGDDTFPRCQHWDAPEVQEPPLNHEGCNDIPGWCPAKDDPRQLWEYALMYTRPPG